MKVSEVRQRNQYNHDFYTRYGVSFSGQRQYFWPSWWRFVQHSQYEQTPQTLTVIDVGCGNGRFGDFWRSEVTTPVQYIGIDISPELLATAHQQLSAFSSDQDFAYQLYQSDIVEELLAHTFQLPGSPQVVTLFGVLHHIPSFALRQQLLQALLDHLPSGGEVWFTIWNPERVGTRSPAVQHTFQEDGDTLVGWKDHSESQRFVHWISEEEEEELLGSLSQSVVVERWVENSPGERGNICILIQKI